MDLRGIEGCIIWEWILGVINNGFILGEYFHGYIRCIGDSRIYCVLLPCLKLFEVLLNVLRDNVEICLRLVLVRNLLGDFGNVY